MFTRTFGKHGKKKKKDASIIQLWEIVKMHIKRFLSIICFSFHNVYENDIRMV